MVLYMEVKFSAQRFDQTQNSSMYIVICVEYYSISLQCKAYVGCSNWYNREPTTTNNSSVSILIMFLSMKAFLLKDLTRPKNRLQLPTNS
jgi:hypothetical protein